jgi:hypothetical protein
MTIDRKFARDVAKQIDRRRTKRKLVVGGGLVTAIVLAVLYLTCGRGWGIGGKDQGEGPNRSAGLATLVDAGPRRCAIRVAARGITVDGKPATREQAIAACKGATGADVVVTGDARQGDWDDLRSGLDAAGITIFTREPKSK